MNEPWQREELLSLIPAYKLNEESWGREKHGGEEEEEGEVL